MAEPDRAARELDVVLLGATGFTGGLTASELATRAPDGCRWGLAGLDLHRLRAVRDRLAAEAPAAADVPLIVADVDDRRSLRALAERTRVLAATVGPYLRHGDGVVGACAAAGTDYLDLTGEAEFVDATYLRHHAVAERTGARLVHACGFDSIPHDLGAQFTVEHLPEGVPLRVDAFVRVNGSFSGGTAASAMGFLGRIPQGRRTARERRRREPRPDRRVEVGLGPWRDDGAWVLPFPSLDPKVVARSAAALPRYGPDFRYSHSIVVGSLPVAVGAVAGVAAFGLLAQLPPVRRGVERLVPAGTGPSEERRAAGWFEVRFRGTGGGRRVVARVAGGDPGYTETSKMLAESALCLAFDELPDVAGQVTTAVAMGPVLRRRLEAAGISFVVDDDTRA